MSGLPMFQSPSSRVAAVLDQRERWQQSLMSHVGREFGEGDGRLRLSINDVAMLLRLLRYRALTRDLLQTEAHRSAESLRRRLRLLVQAGLVSQRGWTSGRTVYLASRLTGRLAGIDGDAPSGGSNQMDHRLTIATLGISWENSGLQVITEYEAGRHPLMPLHARNAPPSANPRQSERKQLLDYLYGTWKHLPDLVVQNPDGTVVAVEIELTRKDKARLQAIMRGYAYSTGSGKIFNEVGYYVVNQDIENVVQHAAAQSNLVNFAVVVLRNKLR